MFAWSQPAKTSFSLLLILLDLDITHMFPLPLEVTLPEPLATPRVSPGAILVVGVSLASQRHWPPGGEFLNKDEQFVASLWISWDSFTSAVWVCLTTLNDATVENSNGKDRSILCILISMLTMLSLTKSNEPQSPLCLCLGFVSELGWSYHCEWLLPYAAQVVLIWLIITALTPPSAPAQLWWGENFLSTLLSSAIKTG